MGELDGGFDVYDYDQVHVSAGFTEYSWECSIDSTM